MGLRIMRLKHIDVLDFLNNTRRLAFSNQAVFINGFPVSFVYLCIGTADYCFYTKSCYVIPHMDSLILRVSRFPFSYLEDETMTKVRYDVLRQIVTISIMENRVDTGVPDGAFSPV